MTSRPPATSMDLTNERRDYQGPRLLESSTPADPFELFTEWMQAALDAALGDATAMAVSTCSSDGRPSSRMILLKGHDRRGFVFFTRYSTQKGTELLANPRASLLFYWRELERQVRVDALLQRLSLAENQAYFATRPRGSQLAARAASNLGRIADAETLDERFRTESERWQGQQVPMPVDWGGYRAEPDRIEFWQGRPNRLHDRLVYELGSDAGWSKYRLAP
jgi:pyridoxamine 5'-phosphate oxidase